MEIKPERIYPNIDVTVGNKLEGHLEVVFGLEGMNRLITVFYT
jgi:hypothetical protein